ncbi:hypothetical protein KAX08_09080 [candidate division WOR-3 bacterium]|nr:hypothetical protein [candidate division WOR-3 bacterium]
MKGKKKEKRSAEEDFINISNLMYHLAYEEEFRRMKVKMEALDIFLEEVSEGTIENPREFIEEGIKRTFTPAILSIIKEKLKRFADRYKRETKGEAALLILGLIYNGISLSQIPFFIAIFARSASRRPLAENDNIWKLLYGFLPKRIEEGTTEIMKKPEFTKEIKDRYEEHDSGLLIPKRKGKVKEESSRIILPGDE